MGLGSTQIKKDEGIGMVELSLEQAFERAEYHVEKGEVSEARKFYQAILSAVPDNERALTALAALQEGQSLTNVGDPPQEVTTQLVNLYNSGQLVATVEQARTLTDQYPKAFIIWNILGAAHKGLGKTFEASQAFKKVTKLNPTYADGFNNLGTTLKEQGRLEEAIEAFEKAIFLKPGYAEAYYNMGITLQEKGKLEEAIEAYEKALAIKPDYVDTYYNMGNALKDQGKLEEAIEAYEKALAIKPDYVDAYNNMGNALKDRGKLEEAIEAYNKVLTIKPDYEASRASKVHQQARICDWQSIEEDCSLLPRLGISGDAISPFAVTFFGNRGPAVPFVTLGLNAPGCDAHLQSVFGSLSGANSSGIASVTVAIPSSAALIGAELSGQSVCLTSNNAALLHSSNGLEGTVGG